MALDNIHFHVMQAQLGLLARARNFLLVVPPWPTPFVCNVCGKASVSPLRDLAFRDFPSCRHCGSTSRIRQLVSMLSRELFSRDVALPSFPERRDIVGCSLSDWEGMANQLAARLNYVNTFLHKEPRLDITAVPAEFAGRFDFVISSDVFEHIDPPVSRAFIGLRRLLKQGGFAIFTVPWVHMDATIEHFPELYQYRIERDDQGWLLYNTTRNGQKQLFRNLQFHGGEGQVLELRLFALSHLIEEARNAGMSATIVRGHVPLRGIYRLSCHSHPLLLRPLA